MRRVSFRIVVRRNRRQLQFLARFIEKYLCLLCMTFHVEFVSSLGIEDSLISVADQDVCEASSAVVLYDGEGVIDGNFTRRCLGGELFDDLQTKPIGQLPGYGCPCRACINERVRHLYRFFPTGRVRNPDSHPHVAHSTPWRPVLRSGD